MEWREGGCENLVQSTQWTGPGNTDTGHCIIVFYRIMCCIVKYDNLGKSRLSEESDFVNKDEIVGIVVFISSIIVRSIFKRFSYRD